MMKFILLTIAIAPAGLFGCETAQRTDPARRPTVGMIEPDGAEHREFSTPWGFTFLAGQSPNGPGYFLGVKNSDARAIGEQPTLLVARDFSPNHVTGFLADRHAKAVLQAGVLTAVFNPVNNRVYFAFRTSGTLEWFGHEISSQDDGIVMLSSLDEDGALKRWHLNACGEGTILRGVPWVEIDGSLDFIASWTATYDRETGERGQSPQSQAIVLNTTPRNPGDGDAYLVNIWEGTRFVDPAGLHSGGRYKVCGYLAAGHASHPFLPELAIIVCSIEEIR